MSNNFFQALLLLSCVISGDVNSRKLPFFFPPPSQKNSFFPTRFAKMRFGRRGGMTLISGVFFPERREKWETINNRAAKFIFLVSLPPHKKGKKPSPFFSGKPTVEHKKIFFSPFPLTLKIFVWGLLAQMHVVVYRVRRKPKPNFPPPQDPLSHQMTPPLRKKKNLARSVSQKTFLSRYTYRVDDYAKFKRILSSLLTYELKPP